MIIGNKIKVLLEKKKMKMIPNFRLFDKKLRLMLVVHVIDFYERTIECYADDLGTNRQEVYSYEMDEDNYVLMKSTGLYDIGKDEVFEGDIVYDDHDEEYGVVEFDEAKFVISWQSRYVEDLFERIDILSVISNIHKEPELVTPTFNPELRLK